MRFFKNLFGQETAAAAAPNPRLPINESIGESIWKAAEDQGKMGTIKVESGELKVTFLMYSLARIQGLEDKVAATKRSRLNATEAAIDFFTFGLGTVAGSIKDAGGDFGQFDRIGRALLALFQTQWRPLAEQIDKGKKPVSKVSFRLEVALPPDSKLKPADVQFWAKEGMAPLMKFLNSYV
jgi:hypothetical protein